MSLAPRVVARRSRSDRRRRADQRQVLGRRCRWAARPRVVGHVEGGIDDVAGHDPIGRVLAAADPGQAVGLGRHPMLARRLDGRAVGALVRDERTESGVRADEVVAREVDVEGPVHGGQELGDVVAGRDDLVRLAVERDVGRPDDPVIGPRNEEHDLAGDPDGQPRGRDDAVAADDDVGAAAGADRRRSGSTRAAGGNGTVGTTGPDAGGVDDRPGADVELGAAQLVGHVGAADPPALVQRAVGPDPGRHDRAALLGRPGDGEGEAGVVLDPVVEDERAAQALVAEGRRVLEGRLGPEVAMAAAVLGGAEEVVQREPRPVERPGQDVAVEREEERLEADEVGGEAEQPASLGQRLADEADPELLEIAQPAVDEPRRPARRPGRDVVSLDQGGPEAAARGVERGPAAGDPAADDEHVPALVGEAGEVGRRRPRREPPRGASV